MAIGPGKSVHSLILDSGPILKNEPPVSTLLGMSESLYTVPAVIEEIRDTVSRSRIETTLIPFLNLRIPSPSSIKIISDFARRTGDLEALSKPDIQVLALAYQLECERNHGDWRLRSMPGQKRLNGVPPASLTPISHPPEPATLLGDIDSEDKLAPEVAPKLILPLPKTKGGITTSADKKISPRTSEDDNLDNEQSDEDGWITPSNFKKGKGKDVVDALAEREDHKLMQVAVISTDFSIQNVLLRMNLNLLSPSLQRIRQLKAWVLRCHACFFITKDMSKQFCIRCGKPTLLRTSCSTEKDGTFNVHLKKNMQWNNRGNIYSIPKPVPKSASGKAITGGGKGGWGQTLILVEDQKEYTQAMANAGRTKEKDLMDEDFLPSILSSDRERVGGKPTVGAGRYVNSKKRNK